ncbi:molybdopterin synthase catalytic subunit MoaE [Motiliproteus sp. SC1-56]|uniref:molybdopterin synthase catalytic subunit MoaE n=1 Tax=Motiliproteus sp. SC1-56 TaxID=2799565 RepID=UPI00351C9FF3
MSLISIRVQPEDFDLNQHYQALRGKGNGVGAIVTFTGLVRDLPNGALAAMELEHYPGMTEKCLRNIAEQAVARWALLGVHIVHRVGALSPGDQIVLVATASAHRRDAFAAAEFIMDYLKKDAPFWKKERTAAGEHWVEQKESDRRAAGRWQR